MALKKSFPLLVAVSLLCAPLAAQADSTEQVVDGGTCIPYPQTGGFNHNHLLFGFSGSAFCHLMMTSDWPVNKLTHVFFTAWSNDVNQVVTARLCVHSSDWAVACGSAATISHAPEDSFVTPPPLPPSAYGAFVRFDFAPNSNSGVIQLVPLWQK